MKSKRRRKGISSLLPALFLLACASSHHAVSHKSAVDPVPIGTTEGLASYYARSLHGRKTASGERYDERQFTAASPTLPFGTRLRVTNLSSAQSVVVRINDRGPYVEGRIIDLSYAAAAEIGLLRSGVAMVKLETEP